MHKIKFRQYQNGKFYYWGLNINNSMFTGLTTINNDIITSPHEQYTGLDDCDGTEIYEGDILQEDEYILVVKFGKYVSGTNPKHGGHQGYYVDVIGDTCNLIRKDLHAWIKSGAIVVGNICENPELLEVK